MEQFRNETKSFLRKLKEQNWNGAWSNSKVFPDFKVSRCWSMLKFKINVKECQVFQLNISSSWIQLSVDLNTIFSNPKSESRYQLLFSSQWSVSHPKLIEHQLSNFQKQVNILISKSPSNYFSIISFWPAMAWNDVNGWHRL